MKRKRLAILLLSLTMLFGIFNPGALAAVDLLPDVREEMTSPSFWTEGDESADLTLASPEDLQMINQRILETPECHMTDMRSETAETDAGLLRRAIWAGSFADASDLLRSPYFDKNGKELSGTDLLALIEQIGETSDQDGLRYGICVRRADLQSLPNNAFATDEQGDLNFNIYQLSAVRVGEPLLIRAVSKDGAYYYCDTDCCPGWLPAECVAVCADREEWLKAWDIPNEEAIVVTQGKLYLETTNVNAVTSDVMLTMGTVLRRIPAEEYDPLVTGRAAIHNYPVWLPVRQADGSYARAMALISQNEGVSESYLPLTTNNILRVAFSMLGDTYGWGSMLNSADCSAYVRDIYKCFGLNLARNTTWQAAMPVYKVDVGSMDTDEKKAVLDTLPAGAALYFNGHTMIYLGKADDQYYVISAVSTVKDNDSDSRLRLRSVSINSLDIRRMNGKTWLESLNTMLVPYRESSVGLDGWTEDSEALDSLMQFISESVDANSENYVPPEDRIAVFDFDGTLYGERFPTYFNCLLEIWYALDSGNDTVPEEIVTFARQWEDKILHGVEIPDFDVKARLYEPFFFEGLTLAEYRDIVRAFKEQPVYGFAGMTYGKGFFKPMISVVKHLYENGYSIYIDSGSDRDALRVMTEGTLDRCIPVDHVLGTNMLLKAADQGDADAADYSMKPQEELVIVGQSSEWNVKTNKVLAIEREIGKAPILVFGNTEDDFAMANAALQNPMYHGQAYMLLCDNTELDHGDVQTAESFAAKCEATGFHTISMHDDFLTIYGEEVRMEEAEVSVPEAA